MSSIDSSLHGLASRSTALDDVARFAAGTLPYIIGVVVIVALWRRRTALRAGAAAVLGLLAALGVGSLLAAAWARPRPFVAEHFTPLVTHAADASFPSDHLLALGALSMAAWLAWHMVGLVAGGLAAVVAAARAVTGVHYITDVLAGFVLGAALTLAAWHVIRPLLPQLQILDHGLAKLRLRPSPAPRRP